MLAVGSIMPAEDFPAELDLTPDLRDQHDALLLNGGSAIIAPDGEYIVEPVIGEERVITADLHLARIREEQMALDVTGHYARDDVFDFAVNRRRLD